MKSRLLLMFCLVVTVARADFPFAEATIADLQKQMQAGRLTAADLTAAYLRASPRSTPRVRG